MSHTLDLGLICIDLSIHSNIPIIAEFGAVLTVIDWHRALTQEKHQNVNFLSPFMYNRLGDD